MAAGTGFEGGGRVERENLALLPETLVPWYDANRRELPWRADREPYHVWLSEIMLQQTRIEAVRNYYARFLAALPTISALAACDDDALHKLWEGLGYYSRVRNLKKAALLLTEQYDGEFPREFTAVRALPGIGDYTAGAICSICFDLPTPAVDGNVLRVLSRLTGDFTPIDLPAQRTAARDALAEIYPAQAGKFTQALMELGETLCGPNRKPDCAACPCRTFCRAALGGTAESLPVRLPKKVRRSEEKTVFVFSCGDRFALEKRPEGGLLAGLWQFPNVPGTLEAAQALDTARKMGFHPTRLYRQVERKHIFTHIVWEMRGFYMETAETCGAFAWLTAEEIRGTVALPTAFRQFWEERKDV